MTSQPNSCPSVRSSSNSVGVREVQTRRFHTIANRPAHVRLGAPMSVPAKKFSRESDSELLSAIAAGDRRALEKLYLSYQRALGRFLSRFTQSRENIEEIINDTFMVVWRRG